MSRHTKTICLGHDTERGWGHRDVDPDYAALADRRAPKDLDEMLRLEKEMQIRVTYHVVACFLKEIRQTIEDAGHCVAFHSYDHNMNRLQLKRCRQVDDCIRGYRTPRNKVTSELSNENLRSHRIEWLGSSVESLGLETPRIEGGIVKIPILFSDYELHQGRIDYRDWEEKAIRNITQKDFVAFGLHDCYARYWLPHYRDFLKNIRHLGTFKTFDEVSRQVLRNEQTFAT